MREGLGEHLEREIIIIKKVVSHALLPLRSGSLVDDAADKSLALDSFLIPKKSSAFAK